MFGYRNTAKSGVTTAQPEPSRSGGALRRGFVLASLTCLSFLAVLAGAAAAQEVTFSSSSYSVNEGDAVTPELVLSHARSEAVTVHIEVMGFQAKGGEDFAAGPWDVTVPAGRTRQSFSIATFGDYKAEGSEQFLLHIPPDGHSDGVRRSSGGTPDAVVTISDSTKISARSDRLRVVEGGTATINLAIGTPARSTPFTIDYTLSGDTASGADVTGGFGARSITVPANASHVDISIATAQDTVTGEDVEWFQVRLSTSASSVRFTTTDIRIGIVDDDTARISVSNPKVQVTEGGTATVRVAIEYPKSSSFTIDYPFPATRPRLPMWSAGSAPVRSPSRRMRVMWTYPSRPRRTRCTAKAWSGYGSGCPRPLQASSSTLRSSRWALPTTTPPRFSLPPARGWTSGRTRATRR